MSFSPVLYSFFLYFIKISSSALHTNRLYDPSSEQKTRFRNYTKQRINCFYYVVQSFCFYEGVAAQSV